MFRKLCLDADFDSGLGTAEEVSTALALGVYNVASVRVVAIAITVKVDVYLEISNDMVNWVQLSGFSVTEVGLAQGTVTELATKYIRLRLLLADTGMAVVDAAAHLSTY